MRLAEMIRREDFYNILRDTVIEYFPLVHSREIDFSYEKMNGERLIVNGKLGFISRFPAPSGLRKFLLAEYNIRSSKLKFLVGKAAALFFSTFPQVGKLKNVYITKGVLGRNVFISPQNRSIRFFDYDAMTVDCIIKSGFTSKYFANQLTFRKQYHYDFMIPLLDSGARWFREPILTGHPLARVTDAKQYEKATQAALHDIALLAVDTLAYEESTDYVLRLQAKILPLIEEAEQRKRISFGNETRQLVQGAIQMCLAHSMIIPLCMSHGDFQGGNIWVDKKGKTWLYDWETVGMRSIWYDSTVLLYSLRRVYGWKAFLAEKLPVSICACDPHKTRTEEEFEAIKAVILLEDILFYLEDMLELPEDWGAQIYDDFARRMWELLKVL